MRPQSTAWMHKKGVEALQRRDFETYRQIEQWLSLPPCGNDHESLSDRFHYHLREANLFRKEHNLFYVETEDKKSDIPPLPYAVYLDSLRSGYNVGNIVRTTEALRFGTLYFSPDTPPLENKKVKDASMGSDRFVTAHTIAHLDELPRPLIALETIPQAIPYTQFDFPESGTLLLGNEEYGLSRASLEAADHYISIPLFGNKNSLNVANAYAIVASHITTHMRQTTPSKYN